MMFIKGFETTRFTTTQLVAGATLGMLLFLLLPYKQVSASTLVFEAPAGASDEPGAALEPAAGQLPMDGFSSDTPVPAPTPTPAPTSYKQTFKISAYYSPIAGQQRYVTGSYAGDIRLNGGGVRGADGTPVYPGMIAAPKTYAFGTKMEIPGIGLVAVHDRGGAIVHAGQRGNAYDRLDVWMGHGDEGLQRAMKWGKRTVEVVVYGINESIAENVSLEMVQVPQSKPAAAVSAAPKSPVPSITSRQLARGDSGEDVRKLQEKLKELGFYEGEIMSHYDEATYQAVLAFQVDNSIVSSNTSYGAGHVGPQTQSILASVSTSVAAQAKETVVEQNEAFTMDLERGLSGEEVRALQEELRRINLLAIEPTGFYGETTEHAVFKFQQSQLLAADKSSPGAGIFGPKTRFQLNKIVAARLDTKRVSFVIAGN